MLHVSGAELLLRHILLNLVSLCWIDKLIRDALSALVVVQETLDFLLNGINRAVVDALAEPALTCPLHWRCYAMWIDVLVVRAFG